MYIIFSKFQKTIIYFSFIIIFLFFLFFSLSKISDIFKSVYLQENQSIEKYNYIFLSLVSTLEKSYNTLFSKKNLNIPEIRIYLKENNLDNLTSNLPKSKNKWINSFILNSDKNKLSKIKIKIRGDNPNNWLHSKKSYRVQFRKNNLLNLNRTLDYVMPRDTALVNTYIGYFIAKEMYLKTPDVRFVNVYINDKIEGLYLEVERTKENFLRKRNIMPVNIYNGSPSRTNMSLSSSNDLFLNSNLWEKQSNFNRLDFDDNNDLNNFLSLLIKSINSQSNFKKLTEISTIEDWANYSAYETIMQSWHSYENNNMRVIFDNWKGEIIPIAYDSIFNDARNNLIIDEKVIYDNAPHLLTDTFLKSSEFNYKKYLIIKDFIETDKFALIKKEIKKTYNEIKNSWYSDPNHYQFVKTNNFNSNLFYNKNMDIEVDNLISRVNYIEENLKKIIYKRDDLNWSYSKNKINLVYSSIVPITSINICYNNKIKSKNFSFLTNKNFSKFNYNKFEKLNCYKKNVILVSDRTKENINISKPTHFVAANGFNTIDTKFELYSETNEKPEIIFYTTYNNINLIAKYNQKITSKSYLPNIHNVPIFKNNLNEIKTIVYQGTNYIKEDLIIDNPVIVKSGTKFILSENVSMIFKNKSLFLGEDDNKIIFKEANQNTKWGTISIEGDNSILKNLDVSGGFGDIVDNKFYTSMISIRNVENVLLENINFMQKYTSDIPPNYDDLLHVIYSSNIVLKNSNFFNSIGDALDVDVSDIQIQNCYFEKSGNDSIDFMSSEGKILNTKINSSGDKGISVGEKSELIINSTKIENSFIGIESKDNSFVLINNSLFTDNTIHFHGYNKNWRYGKKGGDIVSFSTDFINNKNRLVNIEKIRNANGKKIHKKNNFNTNKNVFISKNNSKFTINNLSNLNEYIYIGDNKNILIEN